MHRRGQRVSMSGYGRGPGAGLTAGLMAALLAGASPLVGKAQTKTPVAAAAKTAAPKKAKPADDVPEVSEVVIEGSNKTIYANQPGAVVGDITPEIQLSPADIQSYGVSTVTELLDELAPQTRSDRGRGGESPVVLLNGRRISGFNEIRDIPTEAILRIDILPEEVALKYGFTADQRVVNIVLRRRFRAVTADLRGGGPTEGGEVTGQTEGDLFRVRGDDRINLDLKYTANSDLTENARDVTPNTVGAPYALAGNVTGATSGGAIDPALSALAGNPVTVAGIPAVGGRALTLQDFAGTAGVANSGDIGRYRSLTPESQSVSANAVLARAFANGVSATVNATLGATTSDSLRGLPSLSLTVPAGDPFSPFGTAVKVDRYVDSLGPLRQDATGWTGHLGTTLNKDVAKWRLSFTAAYDHAYSNTTSGVGLNSAALQALLNADSPSFNPFTAPSASLLTLLPQSTARSASDSGNVQILANGPLVQAPAGPLYASLKFGDTESAFATQSTRMGVAQSVNLSRNDLNAQMNLDLPLTSTKYKVLPAVGDFSVNLNLAVDQLSGFGALTTLGYGLNWKPIPAVALIVSHTSDSAAPTVQQLGAPVVLTPQVSILDYATGQTVNVTEITGGASGLTSDHRNVFKVGLTLKPIAPQDLTITANYIVSKIDNPIATFPAATAQIEAAFPNRFIRDVTGALTEVDLRPVNYAWSKRSELRWGINYSRPIGPQPTRGQGLRPPPNPTGEPRRPRAADGSAAAPGEAPAPADGAPSGPAAGGPAAPRANGGGGRGGPRGGGGGPGNGGFGGGAGGRLQLAVYHTLFFTDSMLVRPGGPLLDLLNGAASGTSGGQPQQQVEIQAGYTINNWGARISGDWLSGTTVTAGEGSPTGNLNFSDIATLNLRLFANAGAMRSVVRQHPWLRGARITLAVTNLFDQRVRVTDAAGQTPLSYQPGYIDPTGRAVTLSVRKLFF
jgi:hypothetical protein